MSDKIEDGGPAFPRPPALEFVERNGEVRKEWVRGPDGISARDWFAGQALAGWMASTPENYLVDETKSAELAYIVADAMLAARKAGAR